MSEAYAEAFVALKEKAHAFWNLPVLLDLGEYY